MLLVTGGGVRGSASSIALDGLAMHAGSALGSQSHLLSWADRTFGQGLTTITKGKSCCIFMAFGIEQMLFVLV